MNQNLNLNLNLNGIAQGDNLDFSKKSNKSDDLDLNLNSARPAF